MTNFFKRQQFAAQIRTKRGSRSLRSVAGEIKEVSASTLSRIENGKMPDMETFLLVCDWLEASPDDFFLDASTTPAPGRSPLEQIGVLLRMDTTLDTELADAFIVLLQRLISPRS